jgi:endo-1,4-beta-xylanase
MSRTKVVAALAGIASMLAGVVIAAPASAATDEVFAVDFEDGTTGDWSQSGGSGETLSVIDDDTKVLSVARTADYVGIQSPAGVLIPGTTYALSMRVKLAAGTEGTASVRFVGKPSYSWIGNTGGVNADGWTTVSGEWTVPADADGAATQLYIGTSDLSGGATAYTYLVDDILVTTEVAEECTPQTETLSGANFDDSTTGDWSQSGGGDGTLGYVAGEGQALSVARTADYVGIQSPAGVFEAGVTYTISAKVKLAEGTEGTMSARFVMKPAYSWIGNTSGISASGWTTVSGQYTVAPDADLPALQLYIGTSELSGGATEFTYLVDDVAVTYQTECTDGPEPGTVAISTDFEEGLDGWEPRDNGTGAPQVGVTTADAHGGTQSALVSERTSQGSGIRFETTEVLEGGATYELTAWVKFAETPTEDIWLTLEGRSGEATSYSTLAQFTGMSAGEWVEVTASFTMPTTDQSFIYFETAYVGGDTGNTSSFMVDDITVVVPEPPVVQDVTPIKDTVDFPVGVAIDQRETAGAPSQVLLKHFNQITAENYMKPEAWYDAEGNWAPNAAQIDSLMDFAKDNDLRVYGHVLVWHSQTPAWFFQDEEGNPLTTSEEDKQVLRDRLREHINNVAEYLAQWGDYGDDNPLVAFDVVNEVIDDSASYADGMRRSEWYRILGEEFVADAFTYAEAAFNDGAHTAEGASNPVTLFINDYNTEQSGKRSRYLALIDRLIAADVPIDGIGHQFHVSLSLPVGALDEALTDASTRGLVQAVTELDVTTGTPESSAKFIDQGYYYRDAFEIFRSHQEQMFSVTVWGLNDARSWRDSSGGPLVFDDGFQVKPAYYGIVEPSGLEDPLPARLRTANSFAGSVPATTEGVASGQWKLLPLLPAGENAGFQTRWASDHLTVFVDVDDASVDEADGITVQVGDADFSLARGGGALGAVVEREGGYSAVLSVPLTEATEGSTIELDVRVADGGETSGWNTPGAVGTVTLVEALSHTAIPEAAITPVVDGAMDPVWSTSSQVETLKQVSGANGAIGTFHLLWKGQTLYVFAQIEDPTVDVTGSDPWTQDSVEIYVDPGNAKNGSYRYDDTQIRINADNAVSFGTGDEGFQANRLDSAAMRVEGGYVIEAAISMLEYGGIDTIHGLDVQVNDAAGGSRTSIRNWADPTGVGYQSTARWGVASFVEGSLIEQDVFTPVVTGSAIVGRTLSVNGLPSGTALTYQWLRNGLAVDGAVGSTYVLTTADAGKRMSVRVTSTLAGFEDRTATSAQTSTVLRTFAVTTTPSIQGTVAVGKTVKAAVNPWAPNASFTYQWFADGKAISGATKSTFTVTRWQAGKTLAVKVVGSRSGYASVAKVSLGKKVPLLTLAVERSRLNGPTRVGGKLVVTPGASQPVATVKTFQWYADGKAISGATASSYVVTAKEHGKRLTVKVTYRAIGFATKAVTVGPTYQITWR